MLDVGCGTGGFTREIAERTCARVTGCDASERFVAFAGEAPPPTRGVVEWVVADAQTLPFADQSVDRVLLSLVLHQLSSPEEAVAEAFRLLRSRGLVLVRTIAPADAATRVPARYLPSMAAADEARMPPITVVEEWLRGAGFVDIEVTRCLRNARLDAETEEHAVRVEVAARYPMVSDDELARGTRKLREDAARAHHAWIDPRPTTFVTATRP